MKKLTKILVLSILAVFLIAGSAAAIEIPWVLSPFTNGSTSVWGDTNVLYIGTPGDANAQQTSGIYGAGFEMSSSGIYFDADLWTWDSYSDPNIPDTTGWWDAFVVNINQVGYYWDLVEGGTGDISEINDPLVSSSYAGGTPTYDNSVLPGNTWVFGGSDYGTGSKEIYQTGVFGYDLLMLTSYDPTKPVYVSMVLDTKTIPNADELWPSGGKFEVEPVPEPATMLLLGSGLIGLGILGRKKLFKKA